MIDTLLLQLPEKNMQSYERMLLQNLKQLAEESFYFTEDNIATYTIRDAQMAANLEWLINHKYGDEKVIVWAANSHISKQQSVSYKVGPRPIDWMGWVFTNKPENNSKTYVLGFTAKQGTYQRTIVDERAYIVGIPRKNSFERWISPEISYAFVDFKAFRAQNQTYSKPFEMKGLGHYSQKAKWTQVFDGIFYIRDMTPCHKK